MSSALALLALALAGPAGEEAPDARYHLDRAARARLQAALDEATTALFKLQAADGSFGSLSAGEDGVPPLPLTSLALWALCESGQSDRDRVRCRAALDFVLRHLQADGGIYHPRQGLVRYTSAVARQAFDAYLRRHPDPSLGSVLDRVNLFVYQNRDPESLEDEKRRAPPGVAAAEVEKLLERKDLPEDVRGALEFLARAKESPTDRPPLRGGTVESEGPGSSPTVSYEELLRYIGEYSRHDNPTVSKAYRAIQAHYAVRENPDLTKRYGPAGFLKKDSGLYYYYVTVARTLGAVGRPELKTDDGRVHDWTRELSDRVLMLRGKDGLWTNANVRWWEGDPVLATSFAMLALTACRDLRRAP